MPFSIFGQRSGETFLVFGFRRPETYSGYGVAGGWRQFRDLRRSTRALRGVLDVATGKSMDSVVNVFTFLG